MNLIEELGLEKCKQIVDEAPSNAESYQNGYYFRESPEFMFHNGFHEQWNITDNDGLYFRAAGFHPICIKDIRTAIANHERTDNCTDIKNYISPNTKVIEG